MEQTKKRILTFCVACIFFLILIFVLIHPDQADSTEPISKTAFKLNTVVTLKIYDSKDETLLDDALAICDKYENIFSRTKESSELYNLNHKTLPQNDGAFTVSSDFADLVSKGLYYSRLSGGGFDITIEPISSMWDFVSDEKIVPDDAALKNALPLVNYENVTLEGDQIRFAKDGTGLDFGAIAKGYIADQIKEFLISKGVESAIIDLGGNTLCIGEKPDGSPFHIGIQKPFAERSETIAALEINDKSVVSSGIYERYFEKDGNFYHHILNPKTGYPYDNSLISVTIISDKSVDGDGLSTTCFALGLEKGMELINSLPDVQAVFITDDYQLHYSDHFNDELTVIDVK